MQEPEKFDWSEGSVVAVKRVDPIAIYKNSEGDIMAMSRNLLNG